VDAPFTGPIGDEKIIEYASWANESQDPIIYFTTTWTVPPPLLNGTQYGVRRVTVGEDEKGGRVRRHGEHDHAPPRNGRLPGVGSVLTVTVAGGGDQLAQS